MSISRSFENKSPLSRIPGWVASGLITVLIAFGASYLGIQRGQSVTETRLQTAERDIREEKEAHAREQDETIHRREFDTTMKSFENLLNLFKSNTEKSLDEIKQDVREIRNGNRQK